MREPCGYEKRVNLDEALAQAKREAAETGETRYIHYPFCGSLVVLNRRTKGTVAVVSPRGTVRGVGRTDSNWSPTKA